MKAASIVVVVGGLFAATAWTSLNAQGIPSPANPGGGWTKDESRRMPTRPTELGYIVGSVLKISVHKDTGRFIITLDNGQRWTQTESKPNVTLSVGDDVRIQKSSIGSYMLTTEKGVETRVRRDR
jgi:hypothetical protein